MYGAFCAAIYSFRTPLSVARHQGGRLQASANTAQEHKLYRAKVKIKPEQRYELLGWQALTGS